MTSANQRRQILMEVDAWFAERGFGMVLSKDKDGYWADLFSKQSLEVTIPRYGRGTTPEEAAESARTRYRTEE